MTRRGLLGGAAGLGTLAVGARMLSFGETGAAAAQGEKTLAERLGYSRADRLFLLHADDIGMCHSVNAATIKAMTEGIVSTGSIMVPCPWFPEIAAWSREHPEADLGLHLTLTSEWKYYRWRPVTPVAEVKGLVDPEGFLWRSVEDVVAHATPAEVEREIRSQIARARQFGLKPTHVDSHMGTLFSHPGFFEVYVRVARESGLVPMLMEASPEILAQAKALGIDYAPLAAKLKGQGMLLIDHLDTGLSAGPLEARKTEFKEFVRSLKPGVSELIVHLSLDDDEIRHVTGNWAARYHDFRITTDPELKAFLNEQGVKLIGYGALAKLWGQKPA